MRMSSYCFYYGRVDRASQEYHPIMQSAKTRTRTTSGPEPQDQNNSTTRHDEYFVWALLYLLIFFFRLESPASTVPTPNFPPHPHTHAHPSKRRTMKLFCILALLVSILLVTDADSHLRSLSLHAADDSSVGNQTRNLKYVPVGAIASSLRSQGYSPGEVIGITALGVVFFYSMYFCIFGCKSSSNEGESPAAAGAREEPWAGMTSLTDFLHEEHSFVLRGNQPRNLVRRSNL